MAARTWNGENIQRRSRDSYSIVLNFQFPKKKSAFTGITENFL
jgi:hypothetical protein